MQLAALPEQRPPTHSIVTLHTLTLNPNPKPAGWRRQRGGDRPAHALRGGGRAGAHHQARRGERAVRRHGPAERLCAGLCHLSRVI